MGAKIYKLEKREKNEPDEEREGMVGIEERKKWSQEVILASYWIYKTRLKKGNGCSRGILMGLIN